MTKKTTERAKKALQQAAAFADQETMQALLEYITQLERALLDANQYGWIRGESWIQLIKKAEQITKAGQDEKVRWLFGEMYFITMPLLFRANVHKEEGGKVIDITTKTEERGQSNMGEQMREMLETLTDEELKEVQQFVRQLTEKAKAREQE